MWNKMRKVVIESLPQPNNKFVNIDNCMRDIDIRYKADVYNSLSIEGYKVTAELIEKVKSGNWNPEFNRCTSDKCNDGSWVLAGFRIC
jgi:hypothetical protein